MLVNSLKQSELTKKNSGSQTKANSMNRIGAVSDKINICADADQGGSKAELPRDM